MEESMVDKTTNANSKDAIWASAKNQIWIFLK